MIRIGDLDVDFARRRIERNGMPVRISSRAFDILELLSNANGDLVTKAEIMQAVWPQVAVEENNLHVQVAALRRMLGPGRQLIKSVSGRGYRLLPNSAMLHSVEHPAIDSPPAPPAFEWDGSRGELFGRDFALDAILGLLRRSESLTLVGSGGIGKTCLALEAARQAAPVFPDGVAFVSLSSIVGDGFALDAVVAALPVRILGAQFSLRSVAEALRGKRLLVVLDNCEHVIDAAASIALALRNAGCVVLATSREPLRIPDEVLRTVSSLDVPTIGSSEDEALATGAVRLFLARVRFVDPAFQVDEQSMTLIGAACRALDGIPLAIELAAARAATLGVEMLCSLLDDRLRWLTGGCRTALPRHQTMRATFDWSYRLLSVRERSLLRRLGVFVGGFTFDAVRYLTENDGLSLAETFDAFSGLIAKSMVGSLMSGGRLRYRLLEITREYAVQQLDDNGERKQAETAHAKYLLTLFSRTRQRWSDRTDESVIADFSSERDNVRAALDWSLSSSGNASAGVSLAAEAVPYFFELPLVGECCSRAAQALHAHDSGAVCDVAPQTLLRLRSALAAALVYTIGPTARTRDAWANVYTDASSAGNTEYEALALWGLWTTHQYGGEPADAFVMAQRFADVARRRGDRTQRLLSQRIEGTALHYLGEQMGARARLEAMIQTYDRSMHRSGTIGFRIDHGIVSRATLARVLWLQGDTERALQLARTSLDDARAYRNEMVTCYVLVEAVIPLSILQDDLQAAREAIAMLDDMASRMCFNIWTAACSCYEQCLAAKAAPHKNQLNTFARAITSLRQTGFKAPLTFMLCQFAQALLNSGEVEQAGLVIDQALSHCNSTGEQWFYAELCRTKALILLSSAAPAYAAQWLWNALDTARRQGAKSLADRALSSLERWFEEKGPGIKRRDSRRFPSALPNRSGKAFVDLDRCRPTAIVYAQRHATVVPESTDGKEIPWTSRFEFRRDIIEVYMAIESWHYEDPGTSRAG